MNVSSAVGAYSCRAESFVSVDKTASIARPGRKIARRRAECSLATAVVSLSGMHVGTTDARVRSRIVDQGCVDRGWVPPRRARRWGIECHHGWARPQLLTLRTDARRWWCGRIIRACRIKAVEGAACVPGRKSCLGGVWLRSGKAISGGAIMVYVEMTLMHFRLPQPRILASSAPSPSGISSTRLEQASIAQGPV